MAGLRWYPCCRLKPATYFAEIRCRGAPRDAFNNQEFHEERCSGSCGVFNGLHEILPYSLDLSSDLAEVLRRRC